MSQSLKVNAQASGLENYTAPVPRCTYSKSQVKAYIEFIDLPEPHRSSPLLDNARLAQDEHYALPFLTTLMRFHTAKIPFENLTLHYSRHRDVTLEPDELYERLISSGSRRGGHCLQLNCFFGTMLRSIGFEVVSSAARVNSDSQAAANSPNYSGSRYSGWDHMINIVSLSSEPYLVDVGMYAKGPIVPIPLKEDQRTFLAVAPRSVRLIKDFLPESSSRNAIYRCWQLQQRYADDLPWTSVYAFADAEFFPADFAMMDWWINANHKSWFTHKIIVERMLLNDDGEELVGSVTLFERVLRKRMQGRTELKTECKSEAERVELLWQYFQIRLTTSERQSISGTMSEIL